MSPRALLSVPFVLLLLNTSIADQPAGRSGYAEIIGRAEHWRASEPIKTPWNNNGDKGGYGQKFRGFDRRINFTFQIKADKDITFHTLALKERDRQPYQIKADQTYQIYNRPVTTYATYQCSFSITKLKVNWKEEPRIRVIVAAEGNFSSFRPKKDEPTLDLIAYLIQVQPSGIDADLPPDH